jgi:hypothetical protein
MLMLHMKFERTSHGTSQISTLSRNVGKPTLKLKVAALFRAFLEALSNHWN